MAKSSYIGDTFFPKMGNEALSSTTLGIHGRQLILLGRHAFDDGSLDEKSKVGFLVSQTAVFGTLSSSSKGMKIS